MTKISILKKLKFDLQMFDDTAITGNLTEPSSGTYYFSSDSSNFALHANTNHSAEITIDLRGHNITNANIHFNVGTSLTITDSVGGGTISFKAFNFNNASGATLNISGVTCTGNMIGFERVQRYIDSNNYAIYSTNEGEQYTFVSFAKNGNGNCLIQNVADLYALANFVNAGGSTSNYTFIQTADIEVPSTFTAINGFAGSYDFGNHLISVSSATTEQSIFTNSTGTFSNLASSSTSNSWSLNLFADKSRGQ